jgi:hypothetical protein
MRGFRSTFALLVVLAGLLGYIYYFMKPGSQPPTEQKARVFTIEADKVEELQVKSSKGEASTLARIDGTWSLTAPIQAKADETEVSGLISNLASLEIQRVVDETPADLAQYGLAPARIEVGFRKAGDKTVTTILLGDKTATGSDLYVKLPADTRVLLVPSFVETTFDRTTFDLRDKTILSFARDKVDQVEIVAPEVTLRVKKGPERWAIEAPFAGRADIAVVDGLVGRLQTSQMKSIASAEPTPEQLKAYGLDTPSLTATVGAGSAKATLTLGKDDGQGNVYARDAARAMVFTVEKPLADDLRRKASEYRPKDVFDFRPFQASRVEITRNGTTQVFTRTTGKDGTEGWTRADKTLQGEKMDALLSALSGLMVASYVDAVPKGPATPALTAAVTFDNGKRQERIEFLRVGTEVVATRAGEPGAAKVEAARFDEALAALDALK